MTHDRLQPLNLPQPVQVQLDSKGLPLSISPHAFVSFHHSADSERQREMRASENKLRPVAAVIEVWRVDDEWWRQPISRRYVEVVLEGGRHVVLYEDLNTGDWYIQRI